MTIEPLPRIPQRSGQLRSLPEQWMEIL